MIYSPNAIYIPGVNPKTGVVHKIEESATSAVVYVDSDSCPILTPSRVASFSTVSFRLFASKNGKGLAHMRFLVDVNVGPNVDMCKCPESGTDFMILMMLSEVCVELYLRAAKYSRPLVTKPLNPLVVIVSEHFWFHMLHKMMRPWVMVVRSWDELSNVLVEKPKFLLPAESETTNQGYNAPNMMR